MELNEELRTADSAIEAARDAVTQHRERVVAGTALKGTMALHYYTEYVDTSFVVSRSTLAQCRHLVSRWDDQGGHAREVVQVVRGLIAGVMDSIQAMYFAMSILEYLSKTHDADGAAPHGRGESDAKRRCGFCGGTSDKVGPLVAGPNTTICERCTRLACGVLGISLERQ